MEVEVFDFRILASLGEAPRNRIAVIREEALAASLLGLTPGRKVSVKLFLTYFCPLLNSLFGVETRAGFLVSLLAAGDLCEVPLLAIFDASGYDSCHAYDSGVLV